MAVYEATIRGRPQGDASLALVSDPCANCARVNTSLRWFPAALPSRTRSPQTLEQSRDDVSNLEMLAGASFCYLTTTGRVTGHPRTIEIWFALSDQTVYLLSGGHDRSNWVRNLLVRPEVSVRIGESEWPGRARVVDDPDEDALARRLVVEKYQPRYSGDLSDWRLRALAIAIDLPSTSASAGRSGT